MQNFEERLTQLEDEALCGVVLVILESLPNQDRSQEFRRNISNSEPAKQLMGLS